MNLQHLKYALEVEKTGSISKAAENLYMNQPNLSKAIKELETIIGVTLFDRTTKGVSSVTEDGRVFMEYAKSILLQFDDMKMYFRSSNTKKNILRVSIPRASYIAEAFTAFVDGLSDMSDFQLNFQETDAMMTINSVVQDGYNLGIIRFRTQYEKYFLTYLTKRELDYREILRADSVIIMNSKNATADKPVLEPSDLSDMIQIVNDDFAMPRNISGDKSPKEHLSLSKRNIYVFERGSQFDLLSRIPNTYMWVSPMPRDVLVRNALVQKSCNASNIEFKDMLIFRQGKKLNKLEEEFINNLENVKNSIGKAPAFSYKE